MGINTMNEYAQFKDIEDITGLELKDALMELHEGMGGAVQGSQPICKITLPDGTEAQIFVIITTDEDEFID